MTIEILLPDIDLHAGVLVPERPPEYLSRYLPPEQPRQAPVAAGRDLSVPEPYLLRHSRRRPALIVLMAVAAAGFGAVLFATGHGHRVLQVLGWALVLLVGCAILAAATAGGRALLRSRQGRTQSAPRSLLQPPLAPVHAAGPDKLLADRVLVGVRARPVNSDVLESDRPLQGWLESESGSVFDLIRVVCCFRPGQGELIRTGQVLVNVDPDPPAAHGPLIWSLWPRLVTAGGTLTKTMSVGANLKFLDAATSVESTGPSQRLSVRGMGELQRQARWDLVGSPVEGLVGDHQFLLIVQRPAGTAAVCRVRVAVELRWRGVTSRYSATLPPESSSVRLAE